MQIRSALISVYSKDGLEPIIRRLHELDVQLFSTGGTQSYIEKLGIPVTSVESLTGYPSILDGRVKTLHPAVFGGLIARREPAHLVQLEEYKIPEIDCVIVDLYPFEETVQTSDDPAEIIEKIDSYGFTTVTHISLAGTDAEFFANGRIPQLCPIHRLQPDSTAGERAGCDPV